jgi:hypothetical protein
MGVVDTDRVSTGNCRARDGVEGRIEEVEQHKRLAAWRPPTRVNDAAMVEMGKALAGER